MDRELRDLCHSVFSCKSPRRSETSVPDQMLRRAKEVSVDFGDFGTRHSPADGLLAQERAKEGSVDF